MWNIPEHEYQAMGEDYWNRWTPKIQTDIDRQIERHRKADASWRLDGVPPGTDIDVEQVSHDFIFGAHIFNFNQLGTTERDRRYRELFGTLFNSATIAFYWKTLEPEEGHVRFAGEHRDTEAYWNQVTDPAREPHWRRPATDPVVEFCKGRGVRLHGHPLVWGNCRWHYPEWLQKKLPPPYRDQLLFDNDNASSMVRIFQSLSPREIEEVLPDFTRELNEQMARRIIEIALRYKNQLDSWDVVNESATDFERGLQVPGEGLCASHYGLMPGDYTCRSFKLADAWFPTEVKLNINDYNLKPCYAEQINDLKQRGCRIDIAGAQMHLFDPQACLDIATGKSDRQSPESVMATMQQLSRTGLPIHLSEVTIPAPNNDERGQSIQAVITRNLYRLWFSIESMMGVTWWNVVDDCGAPGEPSVSGLFTRDMQPKPAYHALQELIHREWKTRIVVRAGKAGEIEFRGFRGDYRLRWRDHGGQAREAIMHLA